MISESCYTEICEGPAVCSTTSVGKPDLQGHPIQLNVSTLVFCCLGLCKEIVSKDVSDFAEGKNEVAQWGWRIHH